MDFIRIATFGSFIRYMCGNFVALETKMDLKVKILLIAF